MVPLLLTSPSKYCIAWVNVFAEPLGLLPAPIASLNTKNTSVTVTTSSSQSSARSLSTVISISYFTSFSNPVTIACELVSKLPFATLLLLLNMFYL